MAWTSRHVHDAILLLDASGRLLDCNVAAERNYGYSRDELLAMTIADLRGGGLDAVASARRHLDDVLAHQHAVTETQHFRKDGSSFDVEVGSAVTTYLGKTYIQGIVRDISDRKHLEREAARVASDRNRLLARLELQFDSMPIGCAVTDCELRVVGINAAFERLFGYSRDEVDTRNIFDDVVPPESRAELHRWLTFLHESGEMASRVNENITRSGQRILCRWTNVPLRDPGGRATGMMYMCENVTSAVQADHELRASESRYRSLFDRSADGILLVAPDDRILDANHEALQMLGYSLAEIRALPLSQIRLHSRAVNTGAEAAGQASPGVLRERWRMQCKGTRILHADVTFRSLDSGQHLATIRDQGAMEVAQHRLEWQRNLYDLLSRCNGEVARLGSRQEMLEAVTRLAVEHGGFRFAWVAEVLADGRIDKVARYGDDAGYVGKLQVSARADDPTGQGPTGRCIRSDATQVVSDFLTDASTTYWRELARATGVRSSAAIPLRSRGTVAGALMVYSDEPGFFNEEIVRTLEEVGEDLSFGLDALTTRRELRESRQLLQSVIDGAPNPIFACDRERRLLLLNKAAAALYHADVDTAEGRDRREFIPHDAALENDAIDDRIFATGLPSLVKVHRLVDDTPRVFILAKYPLVDTQGHIFAVGGVITDITELRRAHQELQQANSRLELTVEQRTRDLVDAKDRAERADRTKTSFLSTITHELRAPLNAIIGFTDIMLQGLSGPINASQQRQLGIVRDSSQSLLELINELLDIARIEAGKVRLTYSTFDCRELLERTVRAFEPLSSRKNLSLECHVEPGVALVLSDAQRVGQIVTNVVSNAVKFTVTGGVTVTARLNGASVDIAVADTGPGIALDDLPRIFMPFEQVGASHGRRDSTGLGLPIASQLARALGGDIRVASEPGRGSCFTVTLPLAAPQATAAAGQ